MLVFIPLYIKQREAKNPLVPKKVISFKINLKAALNRIIKGKIYKNGISILGDIQKKIDYE